MTTTATTASVTRSNDLTQEIGERVGVSQMQVSRVLRAALKQIREDAR
jgi:DNA-directed RNA polymerase specialized sigma subunit